MNINMCILIPALVGIICAILGYLLGRLFGKNNNNDIDEIDEWKLKNYSKLEEDLNECKHQLSLKTTEPATKNVASSFTESAPLPESKAITTSQNAFDAEAAKAIFGKKIKQDDLKVVEGIGPKIEQLFHNHDVRTWKDLSECSVDKCQMVLNSGGERYRIHKPNTWPKQAKMAYEGKWKELQDWQNELDGGK